MNNNRNVDSLLRALGGDPFGQSPPIAETIQPVYNIDFLRFSLPNLTTIRGIFNAQPTQAVAQFSAFEFAAPFGVWIRKMTFVTGNVVVGITSLAASGLAVLDAFPQILVVSPETGQFSGVTTMASILVGNAVFTGPPLFSVFNMGRSGVLLNGPFIAANVTREGIRDLFVPPGKVFYVCSVSANTVINVDVELEWPTETTI